MRWLDLVRTALRNLGGIAHVTEIYAEVGNLRGHQLDREERASVRKTLYLNSSNSKAWLERADLFYNGNIRGGIWGLRELGQAAPKANDFDITKQPKGNHAPKRQKIEVYRIVRDTAVSKTMKLLHHDECQRCKQTISFLDGQTYSEAHHLRPLGRPHNGPDIPENVVVVCPNCHALFDYFAVPIGVGELKMHEKHLVSATYIDYHNKQHRRKKSGRQSGF